VTRLTADAHTAAADKAGDDHGQAVATAGESDVRDVPEPLGVRLRGAWTASDVAVLGTCDAVFLLRTGSPSTELDDRADYCGSSAK
jgi:hypothetical protein